MHRRMSEALPSDALSRAVPGLFLVMAVGTLTGAACVASLFGAGPAEAAATIGAVGVGILLLWLLGRLPPAIALAAAAVASLVARAAAAWWLRDLQPANDPESYLMMSQALLDGHGLIARGARAYYPPLYPLLLVGVRTLVGNPAIAIPLLNALIDGAAALLLWRLGLHLQLGRWAAAAGAAWLLWPPVLIGAAVAQKEGLAIALVLALALGVARWARGGGLGNAAAAGAAWGLLALTQPALAPLPIFLFAAVAAGRVRPPRDAIRAAATAGIVAALVLSPWWVRNFLLFGTFVPLTTTGAAFAGLVPDELFHLPPGVGEAEAGRILTGQSLAWIAAHPFDYLASVAARGGRALLLDIGPVQQLQQFRPPPSDGAAAVLALTSQLAFAALWVAAAAATMRRRADRLLLALLLGVFAHLLAVNVWMQFYDRHRQPLTPLLMLVAASALGGRSARSHRPGFDPQPSRAADAVE